MTAPGDLFTIRSTALPEGARVVAFRGREAQSQLYRFSIAVVTAAHDEIDLAAARGIAATLDVRHGGSPPFQFHGMIASAALRHAWAGHALYELTLVPKAWALTLTHASRVFVDMSIPDIVKTVLEDGGIASDDFTLKLAGDYAPELHVCQYKESRWDFVARLMEREGLYFYFEQGSDKEKLVITDSAGFHDALRTEDVRYVPLAGTEDAISGEALHGFAAEQSSLPATVFVRDFDYLNPTLSVSAEESVWDRSPAERIHHGDNFLTAEAGKRVAKRRAEGWLSRELVFRGNGRIFGLRPGYRFKVDEHPLASMNREYLATEVTHQGNQASDDMVRKVLDLPTDDYRVEVTAIRSDVQFRPERSTPVPQIHGVERGFVDGPADSEYAQLDEHGRYKVKLHFDIDDSDEWDGKASTWIRMLQPHGGVTEGFHLPLRKGTEVLIVFLGGDPDRPVIVGAVPNAHQPAKVTRSNHTQNVIQTGGKNRFEMEDQDGKQYVDISTPPNDTRIHLGEPHGGHGSYIVFNTGGDQFVNIGGPRKIEVGGTLDEHVKGNVTWKHDSDRHDTVGGLVKEKYGGNHLTKVAAIRSEHVGGNYFRNYGGTLDTIVSGAVSEDYGGNQTTTVGGSLTYKAGDTKFTFANTKFSFGDTGLDFGSTKLDIGTVSGRVASISLDVPGGIKLKGGVMEFVDGKSIASQGMGEVIASMLKEYLGTKLSYGVGKIDTFGFSVALTGLKMEGIGVKIANKGAYLETKTADNGTSGVKMKWSGFTIFG